MILESNGFPSRWVFRAGDVENVYTLPTEPFRDASDMCVPSSGVNVLTQKKSLYNL